LPSIINCPNCNFEQPQGEDYCPNCGGQMQSLLKAQKLKKNKETFKAKVLIIGLSCTLLIGYIFIFFLKTPSNEMSLANNDSQNLSGDNKLKLRPSKIISRASAPKANQLRSEEEIELLEKEALNNTLIKKTNANPSEIEDSSANADPFVIKEISRINLIDQFNCDEAQTNNTLTEQQSDDLISCSDEILSDIALDEDIVLEEGEALVILKLNLTKESLKISLSVEIDEKPQSYDYTFKLPKTKTSTESLAFQLEPRQTPEDAIEIFNNSETLSLFFKDSKAEGSLPLLIHATF